MSKSLEAHSTPAPAQMSCLSENCEFQGSPDTDRVESYILYIHRRRASKSTLLFGSALVAREIAYILRGDWDGVNAVTIYQPDAVAVQNALDLLLLELGQEEVECCHARESCALVLPSIAPLNSSLILTAKLLMQAIERYRNRTYRSA